MNQLQYLQELEKRIEKLEKGGFQLKRPLDPITKRLIKRTIGTGGGGKYLGIVRKTTQFTTSSTSFVDVTDLSVTVTTGANRVLLFFNSDSYHSTTGAIYLTFNIDGTDKGGTSGLGLTKFDGTLFRYATLHWITDELTAGSHTFKVRIRTDQATAYLNFSNSTAIFSAIELTS